jgi:uncharacterized membrane protein YdjX (TVP38/TMEM64 family)
MMKATASALPVIESQPTTVSLKAENQESVDGSEEGNTERPLSQNKRDEGHSPSLQQHEDGKAFSNSILDDTMETDTLDVRDPLVTEIDSVEEQLQDERRLTRNHRIRMVVGLFLLAFIAFVISDSLTNKFIRKGITDFFGWVEENPGDGVLAFILVIFSTTVLFIPGIILTFGSGYVFANAFGFGIGLLMGTIVVFAGAGAGAIVSFLLGRFLLRDCVVGLSKKFKMFEALDKAMEEKGLRIMLLLRLSPLIFASPYLNYGAGGMAVSFGAYTLSLLAILPACVMFVFLGASAGSLADSSGRGNSKAQVVVMAIGIVISVLAIALTSYYVRQELRKISADAEHGEKPNAAETEEGPEEEAGLPIDLHV